MRAYLLRPGRWQVAVYVPASTPDGRSEEIARVIVDDRTGRVLHVWTGHQVGWRMARGLPGEFGRRVNSPWVWIALCLAFVAPFARRPLRMLHLDLAVLLAFGVSYAFFGAAEALAISVPSAYPLLLYLLGRMLWIAFKRPETPPLRPLLPDGALLFGVAAGLAFRIALNVINGNVIDVGYAGVVGADILDGARLYGGFPPDVRTATPMGRSSTPRTFRGSCLAVDGEVGRIAGGSAVAVFFDLACVAGCGFSAGGSGPAVRPPARVPLGDVSVHAARLRLRGERRARRRDGARRVRLHRRPVARAAVAVCGPFEVRAAGAGSAVRDRRAWPSRSALPAAAAGCGG